MRAPKDITRIVELRLSLGFRPDNCLVGDAELVERHRGADGETWRRTSAPLASGLAVKLANGPFDKKAQDLLSGETQSGPLAPITDFPAQWASFVSRVLDVLIGSEQWANLLTIATEPATLVRFVYRPLDEAAALLPVEFLPGDNGDSMPLVRDEHRQLSFLRLPDRLDDDAPQVPRAFDTRGSSSPSTLWLSLDSDKALQELAARGAELPGGQFKRFSDPAWREAHARADSVILAGHGVEDGVSTADGGVLSCDDLADALTGGAPIVILASCGSSFSRVPTRPSAALVVARSGRTLTIGFGATSNTLVDTIAGVLAHLPPRPLRSGLNTPDALLAWELALGRARRSIAASIEPVAYVHPAVLEASPHMEPESFRRRHAITADRVTVPVWHVPGQVACWTNGDGALVRLPLTVDVGQRVEVSLARSADHDLYGVGWRLDKDELAGLADDMGIPRTLGILVTLVGDPRRGTDRWARTSGQLAAVARGLSQLRGTPLTLQARTRVAAAVASDWGGYDGSAHIVDVETGVWARSLGAWPALTVVPQKIGAKDRLIMPPPSLGKPPDLGEPLTADALLAAAEAQRRVVARHVVPHSDPFKKLADGAREKFAMIPAAAKLIAGDVGDGRLRLDGVRPTPDVDF